MEPQEVGLRERHKIHTRQIILDAFAACLSERDVGEVTYAEIAKKAGVGERTIYRHFPSRDDLLKSLYGWLSGHEDIESTLPKTREELTGRLVDFFRRFDELAPVVRAALTTPQGHEMRLAVAEQRAEAFLKLVEAGELSPKERRLAAAALQHMHSAGAWLTMHDYWSLNANDAARACGWAIRLMLNDLKRGGRP